MNETITWTQARRIALRAQGMGRARRDTMPSTRGSRAALVRTLAHTHLLQIDSVSVFARAHQMPVYTRTGIWDPAVLDRASRPGPGRQVLEALAHEAAYTTEHVHSLLDFRRRRAAQRDWGAVRRAAQQSPHLLQEIFRTIDEHGPISAAAVSRLLGDDDRGEGWGWRRTSSQWAVEYLFRAGALDCVGRSTQFERLYVPSGGPVDHLPGLLAPSDAQDVQDGATAVDQVDGPRSASGQGAEAGHELVALAARSLGIADTGAIADYFRLTVGEVRPAIAQLLRTGVLREVRMAHPAGDRSMLLHRDAPHPSALLGVAALVSPFDPIVFHRPRLKALFDVNYRIGIYTPAARRTTGYYSLLFLLGDVVPARVDLRADRDTGVLEVRGTYREALPHLPSRQRPTDESVIAALVPELHRAARWQGLERLVVMTGPGTGELSVQLSDAGVHMPDAGVHKEATPGEA